MLFLGHDWSTLQGVRSPATWVGVTRLAVQRRVVEIALRTNPEQAWNFFEQIPLPAAGPYKCSDHSVAMLDSYFELAMSLANAPTLSGDADRINRLAARLSSAISVAKSVDQLHSALKVLQRTSFAPEIRMQLISQVLMRLQALAPDFRAMNATLGQFTQRVSALDISPEMKKAFLVALHAHAKRIFEVPVCSAVQLLDPRIAMRANSASKQLASGLFGSPVGNWNRYQQSAATPLGLELEPLRLKPGLEVDPGVPDDTYLFKTMPSQEFQSELGRLRWVERSLQGGDDWNRDFVEVRRRISAWTQPSNAKDLQFFVEKSNLLWTMVSLPIQRRTMRSQEDWSKGRAGAEPEKQNAAPRAAETAEAFFEFLVSPLGLQIERDHSEVWLQNALYGIRYLLFNRPDQLKAITQQERFSPAGSSLGIWLKFAVAGVVIP
jgi:hypothetical protein